MNAAASAVAVLLFAASAFADFPVSPARREKIWTARTVADVATNGSEFLTLWVDARAGDVPNVYGARVDGHGTLLDPVDVLVGPQGVAAAAAADGDDFLIAWSTTQGTYLRRLERGRAPGAPRFVGPGTVRDVETDGRSFCTLAVIGFSYATAIFTDRFGAIERLVPLPYGTQRLVAADDGYWAVVYDELYISVVRVTEDGAGTPIRLTGRITDGDRQVAIAAGGGKVLVAWSRVAQNVQNVELMLLDQAGNVTLPPVTVDQSLRHDSRPQPVHALWDGSEFLLFWSRGYQLYGAEITPEGAVEGPSYDSDATDSTTYAFAAGPRLLAIAQGGTFAFTGGPLHITLGPLSLRNAYTATELVHGAVPQTSPQVASIGPLSLVTWWEQSNLTAALVHTDGWSRPVNVSGATLVTLAASRDEFLVASAGSSSQVHFRRIRPDGTLAQERTLQHSPVATSIAAASDGRNFLAVWEAGDKLHGALLRPDGSLLELAVVPIASAKPYTPRVVWNGSVYVVLWRESFGAYYNRFWMNRVTADGIVLDKIAVNVVSDQSTSASRGLDLASDGNGNTIAVWTRSACLDAVRLDADGRPEGVPRTIACGLLDGAQGIHDTVRAAWNGNGFTVAWITGSWYTTRSLHSLELDRQLAPRAAPRTLVPAGAAVQGAALAGTPIGTLVLYSRATTPLEPFSGSRRVFGQFLVSPRGRSVRH